MNKKSGLGSNPFTSSGMGIFSPTELVAIDLAPGNSQVVSLALLVVSKRQPRRYFDLEKQQHLIQSIQEHGILEPLLVRPLPAGKYELVAGERRYRAAQELGLAEVPIIILNLSDQEALQIALIENLQREDLNPVEETEGIISLLAMKLQVSVEEVPQLLHRLARSSDNVVGKQENNGDILVIEDVFQKVSRITWESFATHRLPLLNLPNPILEALRTGKLEYTKARAIAKLKDPDLQQSLLDEAIKQGLSVSQICERVTAANQQLKSNKTSTLKTEFNNLSSKLKKSNVWSNRDKQKTLKKLLAEIKLLLEEN